MGKWESSSKQKVHFTDDKIIARCFYCQLNNHLAHLLYVEGGRRQDRWPGFSPLDPAGLSMEPGTWYEHSKDLLWPDGFINTNLFIYMVILPLIPGKTIKWVVYEWPLAMEDKCLSRAPIPQRLNGRPGRRGLLTERLLQNYRDSLTVGFVTHSPCYMSPGSHRWTSQCPHMQNKMKDTILNRPTPTDPISLGIQKKP